MQKSIKYVYFTTRKLARTPELYFKREEPRRKLPLGIIQNAFSSGETRLSTALVTRNTEHFRFC